MFYVIKLLGGGEVFADYDEVEKLMMANTPLVVLRNGIINVKHITSITLNENAEREAMRQPYEDDYKFRQRMRQHKSDHIFPQLKDIDQKLLP